MLINFLYNLNQCLYISLFTHVTLSCGVMLLSIVIHISTIVSSGARAFASVLFSNKNTKCISLFLSSLLEMKFLQIRAQVIYIGTVSYNESKQAYN